MRLWQILNQSVCFRIALSCLTIVFLLPTGAQSATEQPAAVGQKDCCSTGDIIDSVLGFSDADTDVRIANRAESARLLSAEATRLTESNLILAKWSWCIAALEKETAHMAVEEGSVTETDRESNAAKNITQSKENFQQLLLAYQDARRQYLEHKILYDQHVTQYHNQPVQMVQPPAQTSKSVPVVAPRFQALKLQATDACMQLQMAEQVLNQTESEISSNVNYLVSIKGKTRPENYESVWSGAQSLAASLQRQVVDYGNTIMVKQTACEKEMRTLEQSAITNGDFNQSRTVYQEVQRDSSLNNEETKRAHLHSMFAAEILGRIGSLSPFLAAAAPAAATAPTLTFDQLQSESKSLQAEYESLQQKYREEQEANPASKRK